MTGTSPAPRMSFISSIPSVPGSIRSSRTRSGLLLPHEPERLLRVPGHNRRVARLQEGVADVPERLGIVVHRQDAHPFPRSRHRSPGGGSGERREADGRAAHGLLDRRYREGEPRSHARPLALGPYPAPVRLHDPLADGEAQARPGDAAPQVVAVGPGELPEQVRQSLRRYAPPLVGHRDRNVNVLPHYGHRDNGRLRGVFGRVGQQIADDLDDAPPVGHHQGQIGRNVDGEVVPAPRAAEGAPCPVHQHRHLRRFGSDRQRARLDARHVQQVGNQVVHVVGLLVDDPEELADHGAHPMDELEERAKDSSSWEDFEANFISSDDWTNKFNDLHSRWNSPNREDTYNRLKRVSVRKMDEDELRESTESRLESLVSGDPANVLSALLDFASQQVHQVLTATEIWGFLQSRGFGRQQWNHDQTITDRISELNQSYLSGIRPVGIGGEVVPRAEVELILDSFEDPSARTVLVSGRAGVGKTEVISQTLQRVQVRNWPMLALRVDRLEPSPTPSELGSTLGLPASPVSVLAGIADGRDCLLVIDQVDAVSQASGRNPEFFDCISAMLHQALAYDNIKVLSACRKFDIDNAPPWFDFLMVTDQFSHAERELKSMQWPARSPLRSQIRPLQSRSFYQEATLRSRKPTATPRAGLYRGHARLEKRYRPQPRRAHPSQRA